MLKPSSSPYIPTSQKTQWAWVLERGEEKKVAGDSTVLPAMVWMCPLKIQMLEPYPLKTMILGGGAFGRSFWDFPGRSDSKVSVYNAGGLGSIPGLGRFPGEGNGNPLQYSCLEKSYGPRSLVQATVHGVTKSQARLNDFPFLFFNSVLNTTLLLWRSVWVPTLRFRVEPSWVGLVPL